ncbi:MAG: hypothetical protein IPM54_24450 [Polyangiaceae bacterium]|nr:hypothetical protein [Polyangiaceae bacterium]
MSTCRLLLSCEALDIRFHMRYGKLWLSPNDILMKIDCAECGTRILAEDVDLPTSMAKCRNCNAVFSFADRVRVRRSAPIAQRERVRAPRPQGIVVRETEAKLTAPGYRNAPKKDGSITIIRRWFAPHFIFLTFFCIAWDAFLVFWYSTATKGPGPFAIIAVIFPIAHVAVGVGLTYYTLAGYVNRTTFHLDTHSFTVRHAPLPWIGNHTLAREDIKQLYCEEQISQGKNGTSRSFHLSAILADGQNIRLASMPVDQARYIEELLEERLGISDMSVPGKLAERQGWWQPVELSADKSTGCQSPTSCTNLCIMSFSPTKSSVSPSLMT